MPNSWIYFFGYLAVINFFVSFAFERWFMEWYRQKTERDKEEKRV